MGVGPAMEEKKKERVFQVCEETQANKSYHAGCGLYHGVLKHVTDGVFRAVTVHMQNKESDLKS